MLKDEVITSILSGIKHLFVRKITFTKPSGSVDYPQNNPSSLTK
jgi:hypothetical protein